MKWSGGDIVEMALTFLCTFEISFLYDMKFILNVESDRSK